MVPEADGPRRGRARLRAAGRPPPGGFRPGDLDRGTDGRRGEAARIALGHGAGLPLPPDEGPIREHREETARAFRPRAVSGPPSGRVAPSEGVHDDPGILRPPWETVRPDRPR